MQDDAEYLKQLRAELRQDLRDRLVDGIGEINHQALAKPVRFSWSGIKHCTSGNLTKLMRQTEALRLLPELLLGAAYSHYEPDYKEFARPGVGAHLFNATYDSPKGEQQVWLLVRETPDGLFLYDLDLVR